MNSSGPTTFRVGWHFLANDIRNPSQNRSLMCTRYGAEATPACVDHLSEGSLERMAGDSLDTLDQTVRSTSDDDLERTGLGGPTEDVIGLEHLVESEVVTDELFGLHLV